MAETNNNPWKKIGDFSLAQPDGSHTIIFSSNQEDQLSISCKNGTVSIIFTSLEGAGRLRTIYANCFNRCANYPDFSFTEINEYYSSRTLKKCTNKSAIRIFIDSIDEVHPLGDFLKEIYVYAGVDAKSNEPYSAFNTQIENLLEMLHEVDGEKEKLSHQVAELNEKIEKLETELKQRSVEPVKTGGDSPRFGLFDVNAAQAISTAQPQHDASFTAQPPAVITL